MAGKEKRKSGGGRKVGRNKDKCALYRVRVGKPRAVGNKSGKNKHR